MKIVSLIVIALVFSAHAEDIIRTQNGPNYQCETVRSTSYVYRHCLSVELRKTGVGPSMTVDAYWQDHRLKELTCRSLDWDPKQIITKRQCLDKLNSFPRHPE
jgi:hypothetical protein